MSEFDRGTDRAGRRSKRFLSVSQKYEIWLQLVRQEVTIAEAAVEARHDDGRVDLSTDDEERPILLAVSDNGPQMTSGSTREFLALCAIAQHFGRPRTPTGQAWIESLNAHIKAEYPHLLAIRDPATLRAELKITRAHTTGSGFFWGTTGCCTTLRRPGHGPGVATDLRACGARGW